MRFNKQELVSLASQTAQNFDREGILVVKERQDGFFRRSEGYTARWFRLRGNLLFYMRETEQLSEPMGVIVLGRHQVKMQTQDEHGHWPFQIVWDNGVCYRMATFLESERTLWIKAFQSAPYDYLEAQVAALREKLSKIPPVLDLDVWRQQRGIVTDMNELPLCELALSCDNLLCDAHGRPPSPYVVVHVTHEAGCIRYGNTEIIDRCSNPSFSKTILFRASDGLSDDTRVKIIMYDVRDRVSSTMLPFGFASLPLSTIQEAQRLRIALTRSGKTVGFVTLNGWSLEPSYIGTSPSHTPGKSSVEQKIFCHRRSHSLPPRLGLKLKFPSIGNILKHNFANSYQVTYRFHSGLGGDITVHEIMAESKLCFYMPLLLLDIFIDREKELLYEILSQGELSSKWRTKQLQLIHTHVSLLKHYWHAKRSLQSVPQGIYFKQSSLKADVNLQFAPVNLHLHRMWAHNDSLSRSGYHDVITVGAFTAHSHSDKTDGLIRLVQQLKDINNTKAAFNSAAAGKIQAEYESILAVRRIKIEISDTMGRIISCLEKGNKKEASELLDLLASKYKVLMSLWEPNAIEEALSFVAWHKEDTNGNGKSQTPTTIQRLTEQLNKFEILNSDFDNLDICSCSSKDASPIEVPNLSVSFPNICDKKHVNKCEQKNEGLQFHNDYFKTATERCSSLRLSKKMNESLSFDHSSRRKNDFKSSTSLEHVSYRSLMNHSDNAENEFILGESVLMANCKIDKEEQKRNVMCVDLERAIANVMTSVREAVDNDIESTVVDAASSLQLALDELSHRLGIYHAALRLRCESNAWNKANAALQLRRDTCFSHALTAVTTGLLCWLNSTPPSIVLTLLTAGLGPLCCFEGLLSLYAQEKAMWGDMVVAVEDLHTVLFTLVSCGECSNSMPRVSGSRGSLVVYIPIPESLYVKIQYKQHLSFTVTAVLFNVGINEKATLSAALNETTPQFLSNSDNLDRLNNYYYKYIKLFTDMPAQSQSRASSRTKPLEEVMENLRLSITKRAPKDVEVIQLASLAARHMNGIRFTSCKSAKDRTSMAVSLELCNILSSEYHLADNEFEKALNVLRSEGCRRRNTVKNIGVRKFAFTKRKVLALPGQYRPPAGTYGAIQT